MEFEYNKESKKRIVEKLKERKALLDCPRCRHNEFELIDGISIISLQDNLSSISIGGKGLPVATTACKNCGFLSQHALGALGVINFSEEKKTVVKKNKHYEWSTRDN